MLENSCIEQRTKKTEEEETHYGTDHSQKADHAEILKEK
jgi:hypothetical protein